VQVFRFTLFCHHSTLGRAGRSLQPSCPSTELHIVKFRKTEIWIWTAGRTRRGRHSLHGARKLFLVSLHSSAQESCTEPLRIPTFRTELTVSTYGTGKFTPFCQVMHTLEVQNGNS